MVRHIEGQANSTRRRTRVSSDESQNRMILIVSEDKDHSTNDVVEWLLHFNCPFIRISDATPIALKSLRISPESTAYEVVILGRSLKSTEIRAIWYRRGAFRLSPPKLELGDLPQTIARRITYQLEQDVYCANEFLLYLQAGAGINDQMNRNVNKLHLLDCAREVGLLVPDTMVTGNRESLLQFASVHGVLANKNLTPPRSTRADRRVGRAGGTRRRPTRWPRRLCAHRSRG